LIGTQRAPCETPSAIPPSGRDPHWVLPTSILGSSLGLIDGSVVNVALPKMQATLDTGFVTSQWIVNGYMLMLASLILFGGSVGDAFGQRRTFIFGLAGFASASVACRLAPNGITLVAFRRLQGAEASFLIPSSLALIGGAFSGEDRGRAVGTWAAAGALTSALGPPVGGWLVDVVGWRSIFFLNAPIAAVAFVPAVKVRPDQLSPRSAGLDLAGPVLAVLSLGLISYGLIVAGTGALSSGSLSVLLAVLMGALFVSEQTRSSAQMIPLCLFLDRQFVAANVMTLVLYASLTGSLFLLPFVLIYAYDYSAAEAGAAFLPFSAIMAAGSRHAGAMAQRIGSRAMLAAGRPPSAVALCAKRPEFWLGFFPGLVVTAIGMTLCVAPLTTTILDSAPNDLGGSASGVNTATARLGGLVAVAALGFAFDGASLSTLRSDAIVDAYRQTMWASAALAAVSAVIAATGISASHAAAENDDA
jgi:EmrB/QacA subfamily drug resistance transporter